MSKAQTYDSETGVKRIATKKSTRAGSRTLSAVSSFFDEVEEEHIPETPWPKIAFIIVANFLGAGVLSIPFACSQMGYFLFGIALIIVYLSALLSGRAFHACFNAMPEARALSDIGHKAYGAAGETGTRILQYVYMTLVLVILHLTCAISLVRVAPGGCVIIYSVAVAAAMITVLQVRDMSEVGTLSIVGTVTILLVIIIVIIALPVRGQAGSAGNGTFFVPKTHTTTLLMGIAFMDIVFSFAGQIIYVELMSEMEEPKDFIKAMVTSNTIMFSCYMVVGMMGYYYVGAGKLKSGDPVTSGVASRGSALDRIINALLFVHVIVAYLIEANVVARGFLLIAGKDANKVSQATWTMVTSLLVGFAFLVSNLVPFFSAVTAFASALCATLACWTLPYLFALKIGDLGKGERLTMQILVPITIIVCVVGVAASIMEMVNRLKDNDQKPFGC